MTIDFTFEIGGEAGQGVQSIGYILAKCFARGGWNVFVCQDYESRVRGGHNFFLVRISGKPVRATSEKVDMLIALNRETVELHKNDLNEKSVMIFDGEKTGLAFDESKFFNIPLEKLAKERTDSKVFSNAVAMGAALSLVNYDFEILNEALVDMFGKKGANISDQNIDTAKAGWEYVKKYFKGDFTYRLKPFNSPRKILMNGNEAIGLGALAAGCKFYSGYPMTPSTGVMQYLSGKAKEYNLVVEQAEDEIAALNMVLGASFAGVRAMTGTSGGGFCLMVEALGLAGMTETSVVIVEGQRPGPSTGLPTRTEQGDLEFVIHAAHGEFPRAVLTPGSVEDAFRLTVKAFNLADKYQSPVIIMTDQYLADSYCTTEKFDFSKIKIERGSLLSGEKMTLPSDYMRHRITDSGISPRAIPGQNGVLVVTDSDEHSEDGHITELDDVRTGMVSKRLKKLEGLAAEVELPVSYGAESADFLLIGWGSTLGALKETVDILSAESFSVRMICLQQVWPFPREAVSKAMTATTNSFIVESNAMAQLAHLIRAETGISVSGKILRFDGRPLTPHYISQAFKREVKA
ncbi:MAG: 2-oxoacid:acceptor oxidoreductase subunit alpha [Candidatus Bathyarchaeota archaeon]